MMMKQTTHFGFSWFIGGLLLCAFGFYNGYPLLYADTDTYIECGFTGEQAIYGRSMAYSFFVRHMSLASSLWWVIIAQGWLLSSVMLLSLKHYLPGAWQRRVPLLHLLLITGLLLSTGISVRCSQVMPDIFTAIGGLGLALLMVAPKLSGLERGYLFVITVWSIMSHTANLGSFLLLLMLLLLILGIGWLRTRQWWLAPKSVLLGAATIGAAWLALPTIHYYTGGGFKASGASPIFFTGQLNSMGLVSSFLQKECASDTTWVLCPYRHEIPSSFLWDAQSPLYRMGGWHAADQAAYGKLNEAILSQPRYFTLFVQAAVMGTFRQFFNFDTDNIGLGIVWRRSHYRKRFPWEYFRLAGSRQGQETIDLSANNRRQRALVYFSLLGLLALLFRPRWLQAIPTPLRGALLLIGLLLICNAAVCGGLSNAAMRYQNRLIWTLPFLMSLVVMLRWSAIRSRLRQWLTAEQSSAQ